MLTENCIFNNFVILDGSGWSNWGCTPKIVIGDELTSLSQTERARKEGKNTKLLL
jgi:hypothetical protein